MTTRYTVFAGYGREGARRLARINEIAAEMTAQGPGSFGQAQVLEYLIRIHDDAIGRLSAALEIEQKREAP